MKSFQGVEGFLEEEEEVRKEEGNCERKSDDVSGDRDGMEDRDIL